MACLLVGCCLNSFVFLIEQENPSTANLVGAAEHVQHQESPDGRVQVNLRQSWHSGGQCFQLFVRWLRVIVQMNLFVCLNLCSPIINSNGEYVESIASFKRNGGMNGSHMDVRSELSTKSRQVLPPMDGASAAMTNPPRSPMFADRYVGGGQNGGASKLAMIGHMNPVMGMPQMDNVNGIGGGGGGGDWSAFSRTSARSKNSYSGTSWSSRKSHSSERD